VKPLEGVQEGQEVNLRPGHTFKEGNLKPKFGSGVRVKKKKDRSL